MLWMVTEGNRNDGGVAAGGEHGRAVHSLKIHPAEPPRLGVEMRAGTQKLPRPLNTYVHL